MVLEWLESLFFGAFDGVQLAPRAPASRPSALCARARPCGSLCACHLSRAAGMAPSWCMILAATND